MFCRSLLCPFVLFLLANVLSVLHRYMDSDYPFGIFKLFLLTREAAVIESTVAKRKRTKEQTAIYKALRRKLKIEENEPH